MAWTAWQETHPAGSEVEALPSCIPSLVGLGFGGVRVKPLDVGPQAEIEVSRV